VAAVPDFLNGGGEMGQLIRDFDWTATPIGAPDAWPQSLRTTVRLMLNTNHPIFLFWGESLTCFYNDAYRATMGPELHPGSLGASGREVWAEIWHIIEPEIELVMSGGGATWNENKLIPITRHGKLDNIWWTYSYSPIDDESSANGIGGVLVLCTDVTAQHNVTEALKQERERLMGLFKQAHGFIAVLYGKDHVFNIANDSYRRLVNNRDVVGLTVREALPELEGQGFYELLDHVYQSGQPFIGNNVPIVLQLQSDGTTETRYLSFIYQPIRNANGEVIGIFAEGQDNTASQLVEIQLRQTLEDKNAIIEHTKDIICVFDERGYFISINKRSMDVLGYDASEINGRHFADFLVKEDIDASVQGFSSVLSGTPISNFENRYLHKDGHIVHILWSAAWSSEQQKLFAIGKDITDRLKAEELARAAQKSEAIGHLTGGMAHEFNNLLTVILGNAEILSEKLQDNPESRALANMILEASERGAELTQRLLAFARRQPLAPRSVNVERMINGLNSLLRRTLGEHVEIGLVCHSELYPAMVDEAQLESAILNLCINSRDAMPAGGRLTIVASNTYLDEAFAGQHSDIEPGHYVMISVADTGTGIAPENLPRVFEPFFTTKDVGHGTGLGLSMVYGFIKQSAGHVTIASEPGQGTVVKLYIPRALMADSELQPPARDSLIKGSECILLVEDDELVRHYVLSQLTHLGYTVITAANGDAALKIMRERTDIDLLFTDIVMPGGISGLDVAEQVKLMCPELIILYTSGYSNHELPSRKPDGGETKLLRKPYSRLALATALRQALEN